MEELEAVDWYNQRQEAAADPELKEILAHNRDEEKEHAMMVLEWLRRHDSVFNEMIATYLNSTGSIVQVEAADSGTAGAGDGSLGIGSLKTSRAGAVA
jgi:ferritin-like protein